jgi:hypothetical protein
MNHGKRIVTHNFIITVYCHGIENDRLSSLNAFIICCPPSLTDIPQHGKSSLLNVNQAQQRYPNSNDPEHHSCNEFIGKVMCEVELKTTQSETQPASVADCISEHYKDLCCFHPSWNKHFCWNPSRLQTGCPVTYSPCTPMFHFGSRFFLWE